MPGRSGSGSHQSQLQGMTWRVLTAGLAQSQPSQLEVEEQGSWRCGSLRVRQSSSSSTRPARETGALERGFIFLLAL